MKAFVEQDTCIGCGLCESVCPEVFRMTDCNVAEVYGEITPGNEDSAFEAESGCPVSVISINDD